MRCAPRSAGRAPPGERDARGAQTQGRGAARPRTLVGTSGWRLPQWRGVFYPEALPREEWLAFYAAQFGCVELDRSFYALPAASAVQRWRDRVGGDFRFAVRAPRTITHYKKLGNCADVLDAFLARMQGFGERLGPILFQLPPRWRCNLRRLEGFLERLPAGPRYAFELRDPSWQCSEVHALLARYAAALCVHDADGRPSPAVATADFVYVRLYGPAGEPPGGYRAHTLRGWARRALGWNRAGKTVYLFFASDARAFAVRNAQHTRSFLEDRTCG